MELQETAKRVHSLKTTYAYCVIIIGTSMQRVCLSVPWESEVGGQASAQSPDVYKKIRKNKGNTSNTNTNNYILFKMSFLFRTLKGDTQKDTKNA
jgi:hypothetical protein